jgi:hypothetical protein
LCQDQPLINLNTEMQGLGALIIMQMYS